MDEPVIPASADPKAHRAQVAIAAAGKLSKIVWAKLSGQDSTPNARDEHRQWGEIAAAAAVEGAVFGGTKAVVDRAGAKAFAKAAGTWPR